VFTVWYLVVTRRKFFRPFYSPPAVEAMSWREEIWPMQWRLASQATLQYFLFFLYTPVLFQYRGPVEAGRMGMTLQLVYAVQGVATLWVGTRVPHFGMLVARQQFEALDAEWRKATWLSLCMMIAGVVALVSAIYVVDVVRPGFSTRVVPPVEFVMLTIGGIFSLVAHSFSIYLRAHKKEVLTVAAFATAISMGLLVWQLGSRYGSLGMSAANLFVNAGVSFPMVYYVWKKSKEEWHSRRGAPTQVDGHP
jgi:hypothetical protein